MSVFTPLAKGLSALKSVLTGLRITGRTVATPWETVLYPMAEAENLDTYRGHIELVPGETDPGKPRCIGCGSCMLACPSNCIDVDCAQDPRPLAGPHGPGAQELAGTLLPLAAMGMQPQFFTPKRYVLEYSTCSLCGQCVRACPVGAIRFSDHIYYVATSRDGMRLDLLARLRNQAAKAARGGENGPAQGCEGDETKGQAEPGGADEHRLAADPPGKGA